MNYHYVMFLHYQKPIKHLIFYYKSIIFILINIFINWKLNYNKNLIIFNYTERNYHIFYQLCAGCPAAERKDLGITTFDQYNYLNQGGDGTIPGVDDEAEFSITQRALSATGIPVSLQW